MKKLLLFLKLNTLIPKIVLMLFLFKLCTIQHTVAQITCPPNITVECGDPIDPTATGFATNANGAVVTFVDLSISDCPNTAVIERVWSSVILSFPFVVACTQTITIEDTTPPEILCTSPNQIIECGEPIVFGEVPIGMDSCDPDPSVITFLDTSVPSCGGTEVITRTWTATDACGNTAICNEVITIEDTTAPELTCAEFIMTFNACPDDIFPNVPSGDWLPIPASGIFQTSVGGTFITNIDINDCVTDNCSDFEDMEFILISSSEANRIPGCSVDIINEYGIRDGCENVATNSIFSRSTIEFDGPAPVISCPADATVECGAATDPTATGMATATTGCGTATITFEDLLELDCGNTGVIRRTWTATDACGNSDSGSTSTCLQIITIADTTPPTLICEAQTSPVECPGIPVFVPPTATDNCSPPDEIIIEFTDVIFQDTSAGACATFNFTTRRTWTATDACGNTSTCAATIEVADMTPPVITCAAQISPIECPAIPVFVPPTATDACDPAPVITFVDLVTPACGGTSSTTRTWTATDACGNTSTCAATIVVEDTTPAIVTCTDFFKTFTSCPDPIFPNTPNGTWVPVPANGLLPTAVGGSFIQTIDLNGCVVDNCSTIGDLEWTLVSSSEANRIPGCSVDIINEIGIRDGCGNVSPTTFNTVSTIEFAGPAPVITCPADVTVECGNPTDPAATGMATATISCGMATITFEDFSVSGCGNTEVIRRTWMATDACGNSDSGSITTCDQIITVADTTPPVIMCAAQTSPVECPGMSEFVPPTATDGCDPSPVITFVDVVAPGCGGTSSTTRTWTATDACGNTSTCAATIEVVDTTPPVIMCAAQTSPVECPGMPEFVPPTATDGCDPSPVITFVDVVTPSCGGTSSTTRTWTATDACGNTSTCVATIEVVDTTPPTIVCPAYTSIECDDDTSPANTGSATATDNCAADAEIAITFTDVSTRMGNGCGQYNYQITRTWTATDPCGNVTNCVQVVTVEDTTPPVISCPANMMNLICNTDPIPDAETSFEFIGIGGTIGDNCSNLAEITVSYVDSPPNQSMLNFCAADPAERTLTRTYTVTDVCGNASTCNQTFIYQQSVLDPVITNVPADQTVDCAVNAFPQTHLFEFDIDCGLGANVSVSGPNTTGTTGCPGSSIQYTYTVTDICGRSASHTQTYTLKNEGPEFVCPVDICVIDCPVDTDMIQAQFDSYADLATVNVSCLGTPTITNNFSPNGFNLQNCNNGPVAVPNAVAWQIVTFTATDQCGRRGSCTALVVIQDTDGPVISSNPTDAIRLFNANTQASFEAWANDNIANFEAEDGCNDFTPNPINWSYSPATPNTTFVGPFATTIVRFTATDNCGNTTTVNATFRLKEEPSSAVTTISGMIHTEDDQMVDAVELTLNMNSANIESQMTEEDGAYEFIAELEQNYEVLPSRNGDVLNGVTTMDLILMGQHLLEIQTLDSPYKMIAADINRSGSITALDMIELRRLILLIDEEYSNNTSWRFVDADYIFPNPENPFASSFPEDRNINGLSQDEIADFIAVKIGDLNGSAEPVNLAATGDTRDREILYINVADQEMLAGKTYTVDFKASDFKNILGYQFTLEFDPNQLSFVNALEGQLPDFNMDNFGIRVNQGTITSSWNTNQEESLPDNAILFSIVFEASQDIQLGKAISITSSLTKAEAYTGELEVMNLGLLFDGTATNAPKFRLYQNTPNPFMAETVIGFTLPEAGPATLTIYDVTGQVITQITDNYTKGYQNVVIDGPTLPSVGLLYYQLQTETRTETKKMIKQ